MRNILIVMASFLFCLVSLALSQPPEPAGETAAAQAEKKPDEKEKRQGKDQEAKTKTSDEEKPTESEKLLEELAKKLEALERYVTDVRQEIDILGQHFTAVGEFAKAPNYRMRFDLTVHLTDDTKGSLLEVCDGKIRWRSQKVLDTHEIDKLDIEQARAVFENSEFDATARDMLIRQMGFSGLIPAMTGLRTMHRFEEHEESKLGEIPVYVFRGKWKKDALNGVVVRGQPVTVANMPPFMPNETTLWIGREDGWLYRVEMRSKADAENPAWKPTVVTLEFLNPRFDADVDEGQFIFEPPSDVEPRDGTTRVVQQLKLILQQSQTKTKQEKSAESSPAATPAEKTIPASGPGAAETEPR